MTRNMLFVVLVAIVAGTPYGSAMAGDQNDVISTVKGAGDSQRLAVHGRGDRLEATTYGDHSHMRMVLNGDHNSIHATQAGSGSAIDETVIGRGREVHIFAGPGCKGRREISEGYSDTVIHVVRCR
ncbi:hypothetical protein ACVWWK_003396 [Bradyrhizobium sp. LB9.1b]